MANSSTETVGDAWLDETKRMLAGTWVPSPAKERLAIAVSEIERLRAREKMLLERHTGCGCDTTCPVCDELGFT